MSDPFPPDDLTIGDDELLYIRIFPDVDSIEPLPDGSGFRPNSGEFRSDGALSVDLQSLCTPEQTRDRAIPPRPFHVAAVPARLARSVGCRIVRDPQPDNSAHALIYGNRCRDDGSKDGVRDGSLTKSQAKKIANGGARIILLNPAAPLPDRGQEQ